VKPPENEPELTSSEQSKEIFKMIPLNIAIAIAGVSVLVLLFAPAFSADFALAVIACI
jgi:hypothetical protein